MGNAPGSEQELSRRRNDSCSQYPDRRLGYEQFSGFIGSTRATAAHGPRPTGAGTGPINRVKENVCIGSATGSTFLTMPAALEEFARDD
jgi:hypothetical protein